MKLKHRVLLKIASKIRTAKLFNRYPVKDDGRSTAPFKLVFFCGEKGLDYLNASLISVYKYWKKLPEICIVSDGSPVEGMRNGLINWPKKVDIFSWQECAGYFKEKGNAALHDYASSELLGKKLVGIMYCAEKYPVLYSDSDILWFNSPTEMDIDFTLSPQIKMCQDVAPFYTAPLLAELQEEKCLTSTPFNSGIIFLHGQFSTYPKWDMLCNFLGTNKNLGWFSEQTSFAILKNYFKPGEYFTLSEILIKVDDELSIKYTQKQYPDILARHYVNVKTTTFWRDFLFMYFFKKR